MRNVSFSAKRLGTAVALTFGLLAFAPTAQAANPLETNFWLSGPRYDGKLPSCESVLHRITTAFREKEISFWNSPLVINGFTRVRETAFRPWQSDNIPRRYCTADALVSDGKMRVVHYSIIEDGGFASAEDGVEWCVVGLDRNWAYNPACKAARP